MVFKKAICGYDSKQVDDYIGMLRNGYMDIEQEYKKLEAENAQLAEMLKSQPDSEVIARALIAAESTAKQITDQARAKGNDIVRLAKTEAARAIENAKKEIDHVIATKNAIELQLRGLMTFFDMPDGNDRGMGP
jgi:cell division septum initiation protein DivIVA